MLASGAISYCKNRRDQYLSKVFSVPKPDGTSRFILNLKKLNKYINKVHFKMEDIRSAINLLKKDCFFGTIDLKDAYFSIPIHQKYLRFKFSNKIYEFNVLPFGLSTAPYVFTKIMRPVLAQLRKEG